MNSPMASLRETLPRLLLLVTAGFLALLPESRANENLPVPALNWAPCGEQFPGAECTSATVPLDYDRPRGETIEIALARIPASDPTNKIGTVFLNPGGPGGSGVDFALFGFGDFLNFLLQGRFDIVGFDPRGIGASAPIQCFDTEESRADYFALSSLFPYERAQERPYFDVNRGFTELCFARKQRILRHMSTADVVRDLDLLRRAVGDTKLTYLGFSYGSHIGNTYANLFPNKVRALVIDGVLDPRLWSNGLQIVSDRVATAKEFDEFLRLCDEAGDECALNGPQGPATRFNALVEAIKREPLRFPGGFAYTYDFLIADAVSAMYAPETWGGPDGAAAFFDFLSDAVFGDAAAAAEAARVRQAIADQLRAASPRRAEYNNGLEAYYGNHCSDSEYPSTFLGYRAFGIYAEVGSIFGPYWWWSNAPCANWPTAPDRYGGPWSTATSTPVLVVGNFFDGVTDYAGAVASSRLLRNSRLLSYAGWGHTAFGRSDCVTELVAGYLLDGSLPPVGTVCPANPNPFLPTPQLRRAGPRAPLIGLPSLRPLR